MKIHRSIHRHLKRAFTLMEMMLVLAIIAVLIAIGAVTLSDVTGGADITAAQAQINTIKTALIQYKTLNRGLPSQGEGLEALVTPPASAKVKKQILQPDGIIDPWKNKYQYRNPGKKNAQGYDVFSMGPDGKEGTDDDVYP